MPRFSLKRLIAAATLFIVGFAAACWAATTGIETNIGLSVVTWPVGCSMIGGALLLPFRRGAIGACVGFVLAIGVVGAVFVGLSSIP